MTFTTIFSAAGVLSLLPLLQLVHAGGQAPDTPAFTQTIVQTLPASTVTDVSTFTQNFTLPASTVTEFSTQNIMQSASTVTEVSTITQNILQPASTVTDLSTYTQNITSTTTDVSTFTQNITLSASTVTDLSTTTEYSTSTQNITLSASTVTDITTFTQNFTLPASTTTDVSSFTQNITLSASTVTEISTSTQNITLSASTITITSTSTTTTTSSPTASTPSCAYGQSLGAFKIYIRGNITQPQGNDTLTVVMGAGSGALPNTAIFYPTGLGPTFILNQNCVLTLPFAGDSSVPTSYAGSVFQTPVSFGSPSAAGRAPLICTIDIGYNLVCSVPALQPQPLFLGMSRLTPGTYPGLVLTNDPAQDRVNNFFPAALKVVPSKPTF